MHDIFIKQPLILLWFRFGAIWGQSSPLKAGKNVTNVEQRV